MNILPSPAELDYFLEVSSTLNLSRASERLGISQPSLSLAIKRLEQVIGTSLFVRHKQGVTLTQAGKQLLAHTRQLKQYWDHTKSQALASHEEVRGSFTLGCHSAIAVYLVSQCLPTLLQQHPQLEIHLKHDISRRITERVIQLSFDLGIVVNPLRHPDLVIIKLCKDEFTFWVSKQDHTDQTDHFRHSVLLCEPDSAQSQILLKKCKQAGIEPTRILTVNSLEVIASLTASGSGIGLLPGRVVKALYPDKLKRLPNAPVYNDEICLIYRNENRNVRSIQAMAAIIKRVAAQLN